MTRVIGVRFRTAGKIYYLSLIHIFGLQDGQQAAQAAEGAFQGYYDYHDSPENQFGDACRSYSVSYTHLLVLMPWR